MAATLRHNFCPGHSNSSHCVGERSSRMTDLTDLLFPTNKVGVDLSRENQRVARETVLLRG